MGCLALGKMASVLSKDSADASSKRPYRRRNMFNLEEAIVEWKRQMVAAGVAASDVLDELESHLRDDVEEQVRSGMYLEAAFASAVQRIGAAKTLRAEFVNSGGLPGRSTRKFLWCFYWVSSALVILIDLWTVVSFELFVWERV